MPSIVSLVIFAVIGVILFLGVRKLTTDSSGGTNSVPGGVDQPIGGVMSMLMNAPLMLYNLLPKNPLAINLGNGVTVGDLYESVKTMGLDVARIGNGSVNAVSNAAQVAERNITGTANTSISTISNTATSTGRSISNTANTSISTVSNTATSTGHKIQHAFRF